MLFATLLQTGQGATWYVSASATGNANGSTLVNAWTSFASINQAGLSPGDVVLVYSGSYNETFTVTAGGTSAAARIMYRGVNTGAGMPILYAMVGGSTNYVGVLGIQFTQPDQTYQNTPGIKLSGVTGWLIQDNVFSQTYGPPIDLHYNTANSYNIIRCNQFNNIGYSPPTNTVGNDLINVHGNNNLVEYNTFGLGWHRVYIYGQKDIVRNNLDTGTDSALYTQSALLGLFPEHIDDVHGDYGGGGGVYYPAYVFMDRNWWSDEAGLDSHNFLFQDYSTSGTAGGSGLLTNFVMRQNVSLRTGSFFICDFQGTSLVRTYNNTVAYDLETASQTSEYLYTIGFDATYPSTNIVIDNNAFFDTYCNPAQGIMSNIGTSNFTADFNAVFGNGILSYGTHNITSNPLFNDTANDDYTLQSGSPLIGAAAPMTTAVGAGTGSTTLVVNDATGFCDGFGIADGDLIVIGSGSPVQISAVNYTTNMITLASPATWNGGDGVSVKGAQDIGALPSYYPTTFSVTNTTAVVPTSTLTAAVVNPDSVRKVEFLVDGIPVGSALSAPYSVAWTGADGNPHVVEARAYNAWASRILTESSFNTGPVFTLQPLTQTPAPGSVITLTASANAPTGVLYTPTYQWQLNGVNLTDGGGISGSSTPTLTITTASASNDGVYTLVASNVTYGSNTSNGATITVEAPPSLTIQPQPQSLTYGASSVTLTATASGLPVPTYQWFENGNPLVDGGRISGSATSALVITNPMVSDSGSYYVVATNGIGSPATSNSVMLAVTAAPQTITFGPFTTVTTAAAPFALTATTASGLPISYGSSNTSAATVAGSTLTVVGPGTTTITASQAGNANYLPATSATQLLTVNSLLAPVITSTGTAASTEGVAFSYTIAGTNTPTSFNATGLPAGLTIDTTTGAITGIPTATGVSTITLMATNASGTGTEFLTLTTVLGAAPTITSATSASTTQGNQFSYTITALSLPTSFSATGLPPGIALNTATGVISGAATSSGTFTVSLGATNAVGTGTATLTLQVAQIIFTGNYFGTFSTGGSWAFTVGANNLGTFISNFGGIVTTNGGTATVQNITVNTEGYFTIPNAGITASASPGSKVTTRTSFPIDVNIINGVVSGTVGTGTLSGAVDSGTSESALAGLYSASVVGGTTGSLYAVIGGDGIFYAVVVMGDLSDSTTGTLSAAGTYSGTTANGGSFTLQVGARGQLSASYAASGGAAPTSFLGLSNQVVPTARLINLSARANSAPGANSLIEGFVISGTSKTVLLRGVGPTLTQFGVTGAIADPELYLNSSSAQIQAVGAWGGSSTISTAFSQVGAFALPATSKDDALLTSLQGGSYSAQVVSATGATGIALAEIYDADPNNLYSASRLINLSARSAVGTGSNVLIAGFVIGGFGTEQLLIRAVGPTLSSFGVSGTLANPQLTLTTASGSMIATNTGWGGTAALTAAFSQVGAFPLSSTSNDSAILVTLGPGSYTAVVSSANGTTGVALVEVYEVP